MFDRSKGIVPAQKLSAYYGEKPKRQGIPREAKEAIAFCQNCKKPKKKCNGDCAMLARFIKTISKGENQYEPNNKEAWDSRLCNRGRKGMLP